MSSFLQIEHYANWKKDAQTLLVAILEAKLLHLQRHQLDHFIHVTVSHQMYTLKGSSICTRLSIFKAKDVKLLVRFCYSFSLGFCLSISKGSLFKAQNIPVFNSFFSNLTRLNERNWMAVQTLISDWLESVNRLCINCPGNGIQKRYFFHFWIGYDKNNHTHLYR